MVLYLKRVLHLYRRYIINVSTYKDQLSNIFSFPPFAIVDTFLIHLSSAVLQSAALAREIFSLTFREHRNHITLNNTNMSGG